MKPWSASRLLLLCLGGVGLWSIVALLCVCSGSTGWGWPKDPDVLGFRLTNVGVASLIGAALAAAGATYQAVLRNPLADPYLLGVSSGATVAELVWSIAFGSASWAGGITQQSAAFVGALAALSLVLLMAQRRGRLEPVTLLLVGVIVSAICGAVYMLLHSLELRRDPSAAGSPFRFLVGGINTNLRSAEIIPAAVIIALGWGVLLYLSGQLNVALLDTAEAESLGVSIHRLRWIAMITASLMTAAAVALSGPIGFIGLVCPHVARLLSGADQRKLLPLATAVGASLLAIADAFSRKLAPQTGGTLPVGVLTGMLGGPFFLILLWRRRLSAEVGSRGVAS